MAGAAADTAIAADTADMAIAADTWVAAMPAERVVMQAPPAADMVAEHAVTQVRLAAVMPAAERPEADSAAEAVVDSVAVVMPVAASAADGTVVAAAMAVADTGNS